MGGERVSFASVLDAVIDNRGRTCPTVETGVKLIATNCISNDSLYPKYEKVRYVSQETYNSWFRGHPMPGDLLFVTKGTPGRVCMTPDPVDFCIAQDMVAIRANRDRVDPCFLFALLRSPNTQRRILDLHVGTLIPHFKKGDFDKLVLDLPPRPVQEVVGRIHLDFLRKIDLNRRMNATLEGIARAMFQSWFVDFDPVRAKANGEPEDALCNRLGLTPDILAIFPDSFQDSELGEIPAGWEVKEVQEVVETVGGSTPSTKNPDYWEGGTCAWATPRDLSKLQSPVLLDTERCITESGVAKITSGVLPTGTVLMSSRAPVGYLAINEVPVSINQGFIAMRCPSSPGPQYVLRWCEQNMDMIKQHAGGSTFAEISKKSFRPLPFLLPSSEILKEFEREAKGLYSHMAASCKECAVLSKLRDALLPKLLSGELRVEQAEEVAEAVT